MKLKTIFLGDESAYLDLINKNSDLELIVCKKADRKQKKYFGSAMEFAQKFKLKTISPAEFIASQPTTDLIISAGFSELIPAGIIQKQRVGIINIHQSFLPGYRGRHPLNWAIINGEKLTGVTIHHVNEKFDDGKIILQERVPIFDDDNIMDVYYRTVEKGKLMLEKLFNIIGTDEFIGYEQDSAKATYFPPRKPSDGEINWNEPAQKIRNLIRALSYPYPGAYFFFKGKKIIIDEIKVLGGKKRDNNKIGTVSLIDGMPTLTSIDAYIKVVKLRNRDLNDLIKLCDI